MNVSVDFTNPCRFDFQTITEKPVTIQSAKMLPGMTEDRSSEPLRLTLTGDWTINQADHAEKAVMAADRTVVPALEIDFSGLTHLDTSGAWLVHRLRAGYEMRGARVTFSHIPKRYGLLLEEIERHNPPPWAPPRRGNFILSGFEQVGTVMLQVYEDAISVLQILGAFGIGLTTCLTRISRMRGNAILNQFDQTCRGAVPIVALMSFLIGGIIAQQGALYLSRFGADIYAVDLVGVLMVREIGVLLTAIMVAGRSGSAFTAELGSMKMREEIDALHVIGMDRTEVLILPRVIALVIAMPILTFVSIVSGLTGSGLLLWAYNGITPLAYLELLHATLMWDSRALLIGFAKAPFMALIIALIGCVEGLKVEGSAESLGRHTTMSVVKSIFMVIVLDGFFALFFAAIGL